MGEDGRDTIEFGWNVGSYKVIMVKHPGKQPWSYHRLTLNLFPFGGTQSGGIKCVLEFKYEKW